MKKTALALAAISAALAPSAALAHTGHATSGLLSGFVHPFTGIDHLTAMILVGAWSAVAYGSQRAGQALVVPAAFLLALTLGFATGVDSAPTWVETGIRLSLMVVGLAIALRFRTGLAIAVPVVAIFGYAHGMAHGIDSSANDVFSGTAALFGVGMIAASMTLQMAGAMLARFASAPVLRIVAGAGAGLGLALTMA